MPELPVVSGWDARRAFGRLGWVFRRQTGSHMILTKAGSVASLSIPDHRELAPFHFVAESRTEVGCWIMASQPVVGRANDTR